MAEMIVALETHPFLPVLSEENPVRGFLECQVRYSPDTVEPWLRDGLEHGREGEDIGHRLADSRSDEVRYSIQTSQAVDIIAGGEKDNQLPDSVSLTVNYRIPPPHTIEGVKRSVAELLTPIAHKHLLSVSAFGNNETKTPAGTFLLSSKNELPPAPVSPSSLANSAWQLFAGTIRQVFEHTNTSGSKLVVPVGDINFGNSDTCHYWNLSKNIYRFSPVREGTRLGFHGIDEKLLMDSHVEGMRLYYDLIRNFDASSDT